MHMFDWCKDCVMVKGCYRNSETPMFLEPACGEKPLGFDLENMDILDDYPWGEEEGDSDDPF